MRLTGTYLVLDGQIVEPLNQALPWPPPFRRGVEIDPQGPRGTLVSPVLLGYQNKCAGSRLGALGAGERALAAFAARQGYTPGPIFRETADLGHRALAALLQTARRPDVVAVAVPSWADLGRSPQQQTRMCERITTTAGITVLVLEALAA